MNEDLHLGMEGKQNLKNGGNELFIRAYNVMDLDFNFILQLFKMLEELNT